jgi:hypothetical protein
MFKNVKRPKQTKMEGEGFARKDAQPEIEKAAEALDELQTSRMEATEKEVEARVRLAILLQNAKLTEYHLDSGKIARLTTTTKATVRQPKQEEAQE